MRLPLVETPTKVFGCHVDDKTGEQEEMLPGSWVVKARAYNVIRGAPDWYEPVDPNSGEEYYWLQHIVSADVMMEEHSEDGPHKCRKDPNIVANGRDRKVCRFLDQGIKKRMEDEIFVMEGMDYIELTKEDCVRGGMNDHGDGSDEDPEDVDTSESEWDSDEDDR